MGTTEDLRPYPVRGDEGLQCTDEHSAWRRDAPVVRVRMPYGGPAWLVTRYADARAVLGDPRFSRAEGLFRDEPRTYPVEIDFGLNHMDPPAHTALRKLVSGAFTERRVHRLRGQIHYIATELVDRLLDEGPPADLVDLYVEPISARSLCALVGVPTDDWLQFRNWMSAVYAKYDQSQAAQFLGYLTEMVRERRDNPTEDLVGTLASGELPPDQAAGVVMMLLGAGYDTTAGHLTNHLHFLLRNPEHAEQLRNDPGLIPGAVEELLRLVHTSTTPLFARFATEDVRVGDVVVRKGEAVVCELSAAHMDDTAFAEPERPDFVTDRAPQLAFGHGMHRCVGAQLARAQLQVGIEVLLARLPSPRITVADEELHWRRGELGRGVAALPVTW